MNILVDGQTLHTHERNRGIGRYLINTLNEILLAKSGHSFFILTLKDVDLDGLPEALKSVEYIRLSSDGPAAVNLPEDLRLQISFNGLLAKRDIDLYWNPNPMMHNVWLPARTRGCRFVATVFDMIPLMFKGKYLDAWPGEMRADYCRRLTQQIGAYDFFMAISWATKADLMDAADIPERLITVTHLGVDGLFFSTPGTEEAGAVLKRHSVKKDFILYTGGFDYRKNMERLLKAYSSHIKRYASGLDLVIVCAYGQAEQARFRELIRREGLNGRVRLTGHISDPDLAVLYSTARAFVFPSLYEGFGLPVIEALAAGTPVAASSFSSVPEILGASGVYFDPYSVEDMADAVHKALTMKWSREEARAVARRFSWRATAEKTIEVFGRACEG